MDAREPRPLADDLRWRLSLSIAGLLLLCLSAGAALAVRDARRAVRDELDSSMQAAARSLDLLLELLADRDAPAARAALRRWAEEQAPTRHVCVVVEARDGRDAADGCAASSRPVEAPAWFVRGIGPQPLPLSRGWPAAAPVLTVLLRPRPADEIAEAWTDVRGLIALLALLGFAVNLLVFASLSRALRPLGAIELALDRLCRGETDAPPPVSSTPELRGLAQRVGTLARRTQQARALNRRLLRRRLDLEESERRSLARELHDEIGQHVAAIEIEAVKLLAAAPAGDPVHREALRRVRRSVHEVHAASRRMTRSLRPPTLDALGLNASLEALAEDWRSRCADWALHLELDARAGSAAGDALAIHVFRIVQEALSNAARHAGARHVLVQLRAGAAAPATLTLRIADDGRGFDPRAPRQGLGLAGIAERVEALGGRLRLDAAPGRGCRLEIELPSRDTAPAAARASAASGAPEAAARSFP